MPSLSDEQLIALAGGDFKVTGPKPAASPSVLADIERDALGFGLKLSSGHRSPSQNAKAGGAKRSYHLSDQARDFSGPPERMLQFAKHVRNTYGPDLAELFYDPLGGMKNGQNLRGPIGGHGDHVHVAYSGGNARRAKTPKTPRTPSLSDEQLIAMAQGHQPPEAPAQPQQQAPGYAVPGTGGAVVLPPGMAPKRELMGPGRPEAAVQRQSDLDKQVSGGKTWDWQRGRVIQRRNAGDLLGATLSRNTDYAQQVLTNKIREAQSRGEFPLSPQVRNGEEARGLKQLEQYAQKFGSILAPIRPQPGDEGLDAIARMAAEGGANAKKWDQFPKWLKKQRITLSPYQQNALQSLIKVRQLEYAALPAMSAEGAKDAISNIADQAINLLTGGTGSALMRFAKAAGSSALSGATQEGVFQAGKPGSAEEKAKAILEQGVFAGATGGLLHGATEGLVAGVTKAAAPALRKAEQKAAQEAIRTTEAGLAEAQRLNQATLKTKPSVVIEAPKVAPRTLRPKPTSDIPVNQTSAVAPKPKGHFKPVRATVAQKGTPDAVPIQEAAGSVLRNEGVSGEGGLPGVGVKDEPILAPEVRAQAPEATPVKTTAQKEVAAPKGDVENVTPTGKPTVPKEAGAFAPKKETGVARVMQERAVQEGTLPRIYEGSKGHSPRELAEEGSRTLKEKGSYYADDILHKIETEDIGITRERAAVIYARHDELEGLVNKAEERLVQATRGSQSAARIKAAQADYENAQKNLIDFGDAMMRNVNSPWSDIGRAMQAKRDIWGREYSGKVGALEARLVGREKGRNRKAADPTPHQQQVIKDVAAPVAQADARIAELEAQVKAMQDAQAEAAVRGVTKTSTRARKTSEQFKTERKQYFEEWKKELAGAPQIKGGKKGARSGQAFIFTEAPAATVKFVARVALSLAEEAGGKLQDVAVRAVKALKEDYGIDASEEDVKRAIASHVSEERTAGAKKRAISDLARVRSEAVQQERYRKELESGKPVAPRKGEVISPDEDTLTLREAIANKREQDNLKQRIADLRSGKVAAQKATRQVPEETLQLRAERDAIVKKQQKSKAEQARIRNLTKEIEAREAGTYQKTPTAPKEDPSEEIKGLLERLNELKRIETEVETAAKLAAQIKEAQAKLDAGDFAMDSPQRRAANESIKTMRRRLSAINTERRLRGEAADLEAKLKAGDFDPAPKNEPREVAPGVTAASETKKLAQAYLETAGLKNKLDSKDLSELEKYLDLLRGRKPKPLSEELADARAQRDIYVQEAERRLMEARLPAPVRALGKVWNLSRNLQTTLDDSAGRQLWKLGFSDPDIPIRGYFVTAKASLSDVAAERFLQQIETGRPNSKLYKGRLELREPNEYLPEHILPKWERANPFAIAQRRYNLRLNLARADLFDRMVAQQRFINKLTGKNGDLDDATLDRIGMAANTLTGKGLTRSQWEQTARKMAFLAYAPSYTMSEVQTLVGAPLWQGMKDGKDVERGGQWGGIALQYPKMLAGAATFYWLYNEQAKLSGDTEPVLDFRKGSTTWGQVRIPHTKLWINPLGGAQGWLRLATQLYSRKRISVKGEERKLTVKDAVTDLLWNKNHPNIGMGASLIDREDFKGEEYPPKDAQGNVEWWRVPVDLYTPITPRNAALAWKEAGLSDDEIISTLLEWNGLGAMNLKDVPTAEGAKFHGKR